MNRLDGADRRHAGAALWPEFLRRAGRGACGGCWRKEFEEAHAGAFAGGGGERGSAGDGNTSWHSHDAEPRRHAMRGNGVPILEIYTSPAMVGLA